MGVRVHSTPSEEQFIVYGEETATTGRPNPHFQLSFPDMLVQFSD